MTLLASSLDIASVTDTSRQTPDRERGAAPPGVDSAWRILSVLRGMAGPQRYGVSGILQCDHQGGWTS